MESSCGLHLFEGSSIYICEFGCSIHFNEKNWTRKTFKFRLFLSVFLKFSVRRRTFNDFYDVLWFNRKNSRILLNNRIWMIQDYLIHSYIYSYIHLKVTVTLQNTFLTKKVFERQKRFSLRVLGDIWK